MTKQTVTELLNGSLGLEQAASIQYLSHAEVVNGLNTEPVVQRLKEIAGDEIKHAQVFRSLVGSLSWPSTAVANLPRPQCQADS